VAVQVLHEIPVQRLEVLPSLDPLNARLMTLNQARGPGRGPAVQVLDITQDGETPTTGPEPRSTPRWLVVAVIAALAAGLGYGFVLGRGDRPTDSIEQATSTTSTTSPTATTVGVVDLDTQAVVFRRSAAGHSLGRGVTEYLNANRFSTIAVDEGGLVWAGGPAGFVRLNPATGEFDRLTDTDGSGPLDVRDLTIGPDGSVYAATPRGLSHWDGFGWTHDSVLVREMAGWGPEWGSVMEVGPVAVAPDGTIWLASHVWAGWTSTSYLHHSSAPFSGDVPTTELDGYVHGLAVGPEGAVWALTDEALWRYDGLWTKASLTGWASTMAVDASGAVWVGREQDIVRIEGGDGDTTTEISWREALGLGDADGPAEGFITRIAAGRDGSVWALAEVWEPGPDWPAEWGENRELLIKMDDEAMSAVPLPEIPDEAWIDDMAVAPTGDLWLALDGKLVQFDGTGWNEFSIQNQPPIGYVGSMAVGPAGDLWLAGDGGITRFGADGWHVFEGEYLRNLAGEEGDVWVASGGEHVWAGIGYRVLQYRTRGWEVLPRIPDEPREYWGATTAARADGSLWLAAVHPYGGASAAYRWAGGEWRYLGLAEFEVSDMDIGPDGTVWLAGWETLGRLEDGSWSPLVTGRGFDQVVVAADGTVWASGQDWNSSEVWRFQAGTWEIERGEPIDPATVSLARDPDGSIWALERNSDGGYVVRDSEGSGRFIVESGELHTMAIAPDGAIWIAGDGRLYRIVPPGEVDLVVRD
jgi:hypothetical protein